MRTGKLIEHSPLSVTVVVCTRDRPVHLRACLGSLVEQTYPQFDVLVVENGVAGQALEISRALGASYLHEPALGISCARNAGAGLARGDVVAFIDDDAVAEPGWLERLIVPFGDPGTGAVTGGTRYMKSYGRLRFMSEDIEQDPFRPASAFSKNDGNWFANACFGAIGDGMNMAFRRSLFADGLRFDERLGRGQVLNGGDEHVAFLAALSLGHRIVHAPAAVVRHPAPAEASARAAQHESLQRATMAYLIFLWAEFPEHRRALMHFLLGKLKRRLGERVHGTAADPSPSSRLMLAALFSPFLYLKARRSWPRNRKDAEKSPERWRDKPEAQSRSEVPSASS